MSLRMQLNSVRKKLRLFPLYMAGRYAADRDHMLASAEASNSKESRTILAAAARRCHHDYLRQLREMPPVADPTVPSVLRRQAD